MKIVIENDGKVETFEAQKAVIVTENLGEITLRRQNTGDSDALGLLELGKMHVEQAWILANKQ